VSLPESAPSADVLDPPSFGRLAQGVSALSIAEGVRVAVAAALAIYLARRLGAAAFGLWTFAIAVAGYPQALVEAGLTWIGTRDVAAYPASSHALVGRIVPLRLSLALGGVVAVTVCAYTLTAAGPGRLVVLLAAASLVTMALTIDWVFYGLERRTIVAASNVVRVLVFAAAALVVVRGPDLVWAVPLTQASGEFVAAAILWIRFRQIVPPDTAPPPLGTRDIVRQAAPLTLSQLMRALTMWSAVTLLGLRTTAAAVGQFGAAQRLTLLAGGFTTLYFYGYVPLASRAAKQGGQAIAGLLRRSAMLTALVTLPFAAGATLFAGPVVELAFGAGYRDAAPVLRVLAWTIPLSVLGGHFRHTLISLHETRVDALAVAAGAITTVVLNVTLTGRFGLIGGAAAMVTGEAVLTVAAIVLVARRVDFR
jgi:PST family polysaccharide transporter